jgi:hypothetical protein
VQVLDSRRNFCHCAIGRAAVVSIYGDKTAKIHGVGARGVVHTPQFNGKLEGSVGNGPPNQRCPRNGKWTVCFLVPSSKTHPLSSTPLEPSGFGKVMKVAPSARIPANTAAARFFKRAAYSPTPAGKLVPGICSCFIHNEKSLNDFASICAGVRLRLCLCC